MSYGFSLYSNFRCKKNCRNGAKNCPNQPKQHHKIEFIFYTPRIRTQIDTHSDAYDKFAYSARSDWLTNSIGLHVIHILRSFFKFLVYFRSHFGFVAIFYDRFAHEIIRFFFPLYWVCRKMIISLTGAQSTIHHCSMDAYVDQHIIPTV